MEIYSITIKLNKSKSFGIFIGNNKRITFDYLLEYLTYNYPEENFCCCFQITDKSNKVIDKDKKVIDYIQNTNNFIFYTNTPKNCNCNELLRDNYTKSKLKIIEDFIHIQKGYVDTIEKMNNKINQLEKEKKIMGMAIKDPDVIDNLKNIGINESYIKPRDNLSIIDPNTNQIIGNEKNFNKKNFIDFYDVIIDIKSIKDIIKGWEIKMSQNGQKNYEEYQNEKCIKIGVIGNSNKGKSFLLSKLSKIDLPSGSSIRTEGLSIKYPNLETNKNAKIILLDSAGLETPVLKEINKLENENENEEKFNILLEEDKKADTENTENIELKDELKNEFKEKSREKLITELFLQNYIINNSDILLLVVGILTYSEQKLINKIKALKKANKKEYNKPLYIIHNLMTYTLKSQVEEYIKEILLKSANFTLEEGHNISTNEKFIETKYYFNENKSYITHLIYANEGSEAGKTYNNLTLKYLWNSFQNVKNLDNFDVIKSIKNKLINISKDYFEKMDKNLSMNDFDEDSKSIKLKNHNKITLKKCLVDELGLSNLKSNEFEPKYNYYRKGDKIIIKIESPGNVGLINCSFVENEGYKFIQIIGEKKKDKEPENIFDNIYTSREFGKFIIDIPIKCDDKYILKNEKPKIYDKKGIIFLEYQLEEIIEGENYIINDEDI